MVPATDQIVSPGSPITRATTSCACPPPGVQLASAGSWVTTTSPALIAPVSALHFTTRTSVPGDNVGTMDDELTEYGWTTNIRSNTATAAMTTSTTAHCTSSRRRR